MTGDFFEDLVRKRKELQELFQAMPETVIIGAVGANGPSGGNVPPETLWSLNLRLAAWREQSGPINESPLTVTKMLTHDELEDFQDSVSAESVVAFRGKLALDNPFGDPRAELISIIPDHQDSELDAFLAEFAKPVQITDSPFGVLTLDKRVDWFEGSAEWCGNAIRLTISLDENGNPRRALEVARRIWDEMATWKEKVDAYAVSELLSLRNENWLDEGDDEITPQGFIDAMQLESISVYPDGEFEFWHNDGDLFFGHSIQICGSLEEGLTDADIPG